VLRPVNNGKVHAVTGSDLDAIQVCDCQTQSPKTGKQVGEASESDKQAVSPAMSVSGSCALQV